ncbi:MAG: tRNA (adenosine(37)-N6)-threonylcarbamoyltransferase complex dimerization subunit type 1 TsaB, partial [Bacteroidetes bacterium]|nr:tRNA (adenosine(37)-N6)-threonylcarbamoyltransferase complex dimerization subunit type 1 TsaB [Bacteroidota bacterium]
MNKKNTVILAIESSCDDTSAAVLVNDKLLSNKVANQEVHINFGGVVPELASRAHQKNIIPVVDQALKQAGVKPADIDAIAFTRGPGLMGSLLVGTSFAKGFALAQGIPLIEINHLQAHVLALFIQDSPENRNPVPKFPFLCLLVSGGHSQILVVKSHLEMEIIGQTIDDAAGEAFDKCGKVIGLPYPAGPIVD